MEKRVSAFDVRQRERFFETLRIAQSASDLTEEEAAQLAAEAVAAVRASKPSQF